MVISVHGQLICLTQEQMVLGFKDVGLRTFGINPMGLDMNIIMMHI